MPRAKTSVRINFNAAEQLSEAAIHRGVTAATLKAEALLAGTILGQPGTGRLYKRKSRVHRASAPGQPPAPDFTALRQSVTHEVGGSRGIVSVNKEYAAALELGTERMAPRPFLQRLLDHKDEIFAVFAAYAK